MAAHVPMNINPSHAVQSTQVDAHVVEQVLVNGDLSKLSAQERLLYYNEVCRSLHLNPLTRPFEYIVLNNKLTLYAKRDCTDQLRASRGISVEIVDRQKVDELYIVTARATTPEGRKDESTGVVNLAGLKGEALANSLMKCETKAKRRVTLSICGLGWLDETEVEPFADATPANGTGHISEPQRKRLFALCKEHGISTEDLKAFLAEVYHYTSTTDITATDYEEICRAITDRSLLEIVRIAREAQAESEVPA